ncbi:hypothetical protein CAPTEDRAFT_205446 [Capitella teleta]|uniref:Uncharacterized protein n=1 Tax=Capitella teleta TaxID=283909 RepID=R7U188_CAPTE|nr:hypothetical protein CAPTEDRAFT_205446 [Capitella teleta]|eukprot:ELT97406.1 hypothetical protein CAPTEDRAFT_205446 [Capitella teleta]
MEENKHSKEVSSNGIHNAKVAHKENQHPVLHKVLDHVLTVVVCVAFYLLIPIFLPLSLAFRVYRAQIHKRLHARNKLTLMSGSDAMMQADTQENRMVINALLTMRGKLDIAAHQERCMERMVKARNDYGDLNFPKMGQYANQLLHRDVWMNETDFKIEEHLFIHPEQAPEDKSELGTFIGDICSRPLPACKSPWQILYLRTHEPDLFIALFRVHHIIADGISLVRMVTTCMTDDVPDMGVVKRFGTSTKWKKVAQLLYQGPLILLKSIAWPADHSVLHGATLSGQKLVMWSDPISLNLIKRIKNATATTVNDVVVSCLAGAFRNYFLKHQSTMPDDISAYIPVDIRPPHGRIVLDNQFSLVFLSLPLTSSNSMETLKKTQERMGAIKWMASTLLTWIAKKCSMVLSNVPGPSEPLHLLGNKIEDIMFWPPCMANVGLGVSIFSYSGNVRIGVLSDKNLLTNPDLLVQEFVKKVNELATELKLE